MVFLKKIKPAMVLVIAALIALAPAKATAQDVLVPEAKSYLLDDIGQFLPMAMNFGLKAAGVKGKYDWRERIALTLTSTVLCEGTVYVLKHTIHSWRPDGTDRESFPSGHAARAFRGAELVRHEHGWYWGAGAYAIAAGVGALRIHHHRHRFGDVVGGAAVGILSANAAVWLLPLERKLFGWDKKDQKAPTIAAVPVIGAPAAGLSMPTLALSASVTF